MPEDDELKTTTQKLRFVWHETLFYTYRVLRLWIILFALVIGSFYVIVTIPFSVFPSNGVFSFYPVLMIDVAFFTTLAVLGTGILLGYHKRKVPEPAPWKYQPYQYGPFSSAPEARSERVVLSAVKEMAEGLQNYKVQLQGLIREVEDINSRIQEIERAYRRILSLLEELKRS